METEIDQERADMESGFDISSGVEPDIKPVDQPAPAPEVKKEDAKATETPPQDNSQLADLMATIKSMEERIQKQVDKVSGNYGEVKRLIEDVKKTSATPKNVADVDISELETQFGPELAKAVNAQVKKMLDGINGFKPEDIQKVFSEITALERQKEITAKYEQIYSVHPDFGDIKPSFIEWVKTLPEEEADLVEETESPKVLIRYLNKFKANQKSNADAEKNKADAAKKNRIDRAITPQGSKRSTPSTMSDDEAMLSAFESVGRK